MSSDDDSQLKDLVSQALESKGILSKLRAELRANVFLAFEGNEKFKEQLRKNDVIIDLLKTDEGVLALCIVQEFLEFCSLKFTQTVLESEVGIPAAQTNSRGRQQLLNDLKLKQDNSKVPVLCQVLEAIQSNNSHQPSINNINQSTNKMSTLQSLNFQNPSEKKLVNGDFGIQDQKQRLKDNPRPEEQLILDLNFSNQNESQEENLSTNTENLPSPKLILKTVNDLPSPIKHNHKTINNIEPLPDLKDSPSHKRKLDDGGDTGSVSEIEEDLDSAEDLLNSSGSVRGDVTQDNSISTLSSGIGDYCEEVNKI